jgi:hypothetical protein
MDDVKKHIFYPKQYPNISCPIRPMTQLDT